MPKPELVALKTEIEAGLADLAAGRVKTFDAAWIVERGRKLFAESLRNRQLVRTTRRGSL